MLSLIKITAFRLESKLPPMRALEFIRDHVTFKLPYDFSYHMKTPFMLCIFWPHKMNKHTGWSNCTGQKQIMHRAIITEGNSTTFWQAHKVVIPQGIYHLEHILSAQKNLQKSAHRVNLWESFSHRPVLLGEKKNKHTVSNKTMKGKIFIEKNQCTVCVY